MNLAPAEAVALVRELREPLEAIDGVTRVICPPFVALQSAANILAGTAIHVGAQNGFVKNFLSSNGFVRGWIGLSDSAVEGTFVWSDGLPAAILNWSGGEPDDGGGPGSEDFVQIDSGSGLWFDVGTPRAIPQTELILADG